MPNKWDSSQETNGRASCCGILHNIRKILTFTTGKRTFMKYISTLFLLLCTRIISSQELPSTRSTFLSASYLQVKEEANYGLVFRGPAVDFGMRWEIPIRNNTILYEYHLGAGFPLAKGVIGLNMSLKPVDISIVRDIPAGNIIFQAGPALKMQYDVQFYPDLQSGYDFWLTSYNAGIKLRAIIPAMTGMIRLGIWNSLLGLTSRTEPYTDPYFFDLGFWEVMKDIHSNLEFSSLSRFINTTFTAEYLFKKHPRIALAYVLDYSYYADPYKMTFMNQSLRLIVNAKN